MFLEWSAKSEILESCRVGGRREEIGEAVWNDARYASVVNIFVEWLLRQALESLASSPTADRCHSRHT